MEYFAMYNKGARLGRWDYSERKGCNVFHDWKFTAEQVEQIKAQHPEYKVKTTKSGITVTAEMMKTYIA